MKKYFIELTQSNGDTVEPVERYEASTEAQAVAIFEKLIKKAREEKSGDGARISYGWSYDSSDFVEMWGRW
jgi:uncharacterized protein YfcZ (UPF0381/DUF406 family)